MIPETDAALVAAALRGHREAFATLVRKHQHYAYGTAVGMLSDFDLAHDVVRESFLTAYQDLRKLRDPERFGGWLRGIVRHTAQSAIRELARVRALAANMKHTAEPSAGTPLPDESIEADERREIVRRALGRLNERNREVVSLYYVDGLSYADIAAFLEVTETAVQGRLQRARAKLREEVEMVEERFREEGLPDDFSAEVRRLLDTSVELAEEGERAAQRLAEIGDQAVDPLCEALGDPREAVRYVAARALCEIRDPRAVQPLLRLLYAQRRGGWPAWRSGVCRFDHILAVPGVREALLDALREDGSEQWASLRALSFAEGDGEVFDRIYEVFRGPPTRRSLSRVVAMGTLCDICPASALDVIVEAIRDPNPRLCDAGTWEAMRRGLLPPLDVCMSALSDNVSWQGRRCAAILALKHGREGEEALVRVLHSGPADERALVAVVLAKNGSTEALDILKQELLSGWQDKVPAERLEAYHRLLAEGKFIPVLVEMAKDCPEDAGPLVEGFLHAGGSSARVAAVRILSRQKGAANLPELRRCLAATPAHKRKVGREAFRQVFALRDAAVPMATEMLGSEGWAERKAAVCLLRRWGRLTPEQQTQAEGDPHIAVRHAAHARSRT